ncbi:MAG TPA: acetyltransferase [Phycisphaerae bacterium]|nr:acetyltransferase [Phycisphaerae bacterium]
MRSVIVGAGGHGRVVLDILMRSAAHQVAGFIDSDPSLTGRRMDGKPVLGVLDDLPTLRKELGVDAAIVAIGDNGIRRAFADRISEMGFVLINAIHPSANLAQSVSLGSNIVIAAGALVCAHCHIGDSVILNTGCIVDHESMIAPGSHVCPGARIAGRVNIQAGAFIGIGATVIQSVQIGHHAIVGAGAVVIDDVSPLSTVVGVPARTTHRAVSTGATDREVVGDQISAQELVAPLMHATAGHSRSV